MLNMATRPTENNMATVNLSRPPYIVASQLNTLIADGIETVNVSALNTIVVSGLQDKFLGIDLAGEARSLEAESQAAAPAGAGEVGFRAYRVTNEDFTRMAPTELRALWDGFSWVRLRRGDSFIDPGTAEHLELDDEVLVLGPAEFLSRIQEIEDARTEVREAIVTAWSRYQAARAQLSSDRTQVQSNKEALSGVREEEKVGQRTLLDVLNAEQELVNSEVQLATTRRDGVDT